MKNTFTPTRQCAGCWVDRKDGESCPMANQCPYQPVFKKDGSWYKRLANGSVEYLGPVKD